MSAPELAVIKAALDAVYSVLGDERLHPEPLDTPLHVPGCRACDAIGAVEEAYEALRNLGDPFAAGLEEAQRRLVEG